MKSGNLNFLEPSGPLQAYEGTALPFIFLPSVIFMAKHLNVSVSIKSSDSKTKNFKSHVLKILHHNVQSLPNKLLDLSLFLTTDVVDIDILCFTEHWLKFEQTNSIYIDQFKLISSFHRSTKKGGGSGIFVKD